MRLPIREHTQGGRLLRVLVERYPTWSNLDHFGDDGYSARNRMDDTLGDRGFPVARQRIILEDGRKLSRYEWRFETHEAYHRAANLVRAWVTGEDFETLLARDPVLARAAARARSSCQVSLFEVAP